MKLTVKNIFRDKTDHVTVYEPGAILEVKDKERAADLIKRGLCAQCKDERGADITLGEEAPEAPAEETPETPTKDEKPKVDKK